MSILKDRRRFINIIRGHIKKNFKNYIVNDRMFGQMDGDYVKVSIPSIDIPCFSYGSEEIQKTAEGEGQSVDSDKEAEGMRNKAGSSPGFHMMETEISFEQLAEFLGDELKLPRIQPKGHKNVYVDSLKYTSRALLGPMGLRHFRSSYKESLKRAIASGNYDPEDAFVIPIHKDFRFKSYKKKQEPKANAVVIYMMDVSGSMGDEQKDIVRLESFWINTWLKKNYKGLETRFIIHDAVAREVDEETFFCTSESGGTLISSAYKLCQKIIERDYPVSTWNVYPFHFSDGDNWSGEDTRLCLKLLKEYFLSRINLFGYGQVESKYGSGQFAKDLEKVFKEEERLVITRIENKDKIVSSIKEFFQRGY